MADCIVACATPPGTSALAVVRVSGDGADAVVVRVCGRLPPHRRSSLVRLRDADGVFDEGLAVRFAAPASYTGEDLVEVSCHGNPLLVERLLRACVAAGARLASPGEFTRRALLNGKLDLIQAEAVLETLEATSERGLELARGALDGVLGRALEGIRVGVVELASELEAILDYPGEDLLFHSDDELKAGLAQLIRACDALLATASAGRVAVEGARVALVGPVNAGKSTLLNALAGRPRALVSATPGTTRDVVEVALALRDMRITLLDTAGERETTDPVEREGLVYGRAAAAEADLRLFVFPLHRPWGAAEDALLARCPAPRLVVGTHADLGVVGSPPAHLAVSAPGGVGVTGLVDAIRAALSGPAGDLSGGTHAHLTTRRQEELVHRVRRALESAADGFQAGPAVVVESLYIALQAVDALVGRDTRENVLDRLFARFCVGK